MSLPDGRDRLMRTAISFPMIEAVLERSRGVCELCRSRPAAQVHHIKPKGIGGSRRHYGPADLEALCLRCHAARHGQVIVLEDDGDY